MDPQDELQKKITERFTKLPAAVREAITSADVQARLRSLSDAHKLHLDQWQIFENEVMLSLIGIQQAEDIEVNIAQHVGVSGDVARSLAEAVNSAIFEPIRSKLEQNLEHPNAETVVITDAEAARTHILSVEKDKEVSLAANNILAGGSETSEVQPATPPAPTPDVKIARPSASTAYKPGQASTERKNIHDDPYRIPPI